MPNLTPGVVEIMGEHKAETSHTRFKFAGENATHTAGQLSKIAGAERIRPAGRGYSHALCVTQQVDDGCVGPPDC